MKTNIKYSKCLIPILNLFSIIVMAQSQNDYLTPNDILDTIYQYYPKGVYFFDNKYLETTEYKQKMIKCTDVSTHDTFVNMATFFIEKFNSESVDFFTPTSLGPSYIYRIKISQSHNRYTILVICISVLIKKYSAYTSTIDFGKAGKPTKIQMINNSEELTAINPLVLNALNSYFPSYEILPQDQLFLEIPDIYSTKNAQERATVFDCLFSDHRW